MKMKSTLALAALVAFTFSGAAMASETMKLPALEEINLPRATENWQNLCARCHGEKGAGETRMGQRLKVLDYTKPESLAKHTNEQLYKATAEGVMVDGKERMKGFKDELSEEEIRDLVVLVRSFSKPAAK
jgi:cytochrome c6